MCKLCAPAYADDHPGRVPHARGRAAAAGGHQGARVPGGCAGASAEEARVLGQMPERWRVVLKHCITGINVTKQLHLYVQAMPASSVNLSSCMAYMHGRTVSSF